MHRFRIRHQGRGTGLLIALCERVGADRLAVLPGVEQHLDRAALRRHGIALVRLGSRRPPAGDLPSDPGVKQ